MGLIPDRLVIHCTLQVVKYLESQVNAAYTKQSSFLSFVYENILQGQGSGKR
jgi:hypothetical protein